MGRRACKRRDRHKTDGHEEGKDGRQNAFFHSNFVHLSLLLTVEVFLGVLFCHPLDG